MAGSAVDGDLSAGKRFGSSPEEPAEDPDVAVGPEDVGATPGAADSPAASDPSVLSAETFLDELSRQSEEAAGENVSEDADEVEVSWTEPVGLVPLATEVLGAYAEVPTAALATSGYLDLKGNVWAALVQDAGGWVDVVTVTSDADDSSSTARIVRLRAGAAPAP